MAWSGAITFGYLSCFLADYLTVLVVFPAMATGALVGWWLEHRSHSTTP